LGIESWAAFALALLVALAVPGPDLVLVVHAATRSVREGASTAAGIVSGLALHALFAIAGATALLLSAPSALTVVQFLGAGILLWMGTSMLRAARAQEPASQDSVPRRRQHGYMRGFITNATNPKALLFFAAILPQFIGHGAGTELRTITLCATVVLGAGIWWAGVIALVRLFGFHRSAAADRTITVLGGVALLLLGAGLLVMTALSLAGTGT
jgi:threonine/homoserine/homoserine lactone efflux protein